MAVEKIPEDYMLYLGISKIIKENTDILSCTFNDIDERKEKVLGIYVSEPQVTKIRRLSTGQYIRRTVYVTLMYQCGADKDSNLEGSYMMEKIRGLFEQYNNKAIYFKESKISDKDDFDNYLSIGKTDLISGKINHGKNKNEIMQYSIKLRFNYIQGGK